MAPSDVSAALRLLVQAIDLIRGFQLGAVLAREGAPTPGGACIGGRRVAGPELCPVGAASGRISRALCPCPTDQAGAQGPAAAKGLVKSSELSDELSRSSAQIEA